MRSGLGLEQKLEQFASGHSTRTNPTKQRKATIRRILHTMLNV